MVQSRDKRGWNFLSIEYRKETRLMTELKKGREFVFFFFYFVHWFLIIVNGLNTEKASEIKHIFYSQIFNINDRVKNKEKY